MLSGSRAGKRTGLALFLPVLAAIDRRPGCLTFETRRAIRDPLPGPLPTAPASRSLVPADRRRDPGARHRGRRRTGLRSQGVRREARPAAARDRAVSSVPARQGRSAPGGERSERSRPGHARRPRAEPARDRPHAGGPRPAPRGRAGRSARRQQHATRLDDRPAGRHAGRLGHERRRMPRRGHHEPLPGRRGAGGTAPRARHRECPRSGRGQRQRLPRHGSRGAMGRRDSRGFDGGAPDGLGERGRRRLRDGIRADHRRSGTARVNRASR